MNQTETIESNRIENQRPVENQETGFEYDKVINQAAFDLMDSTRSYVENLKKFAGKIEEFVQIKSRIGPNSRN